MTYLTRILTSFAVVGAMFLFGAGSGLGPDGAWAQTASKLKCKRCVGARQLKKGAIKNNRLRDGAVNLNKMEPGLGERANTTQPFYNFLDTNGQQTVATHGPLSIIFRCSINEGGVNDFIRIIATSSEAGWFISGNGPFAAGQEVSLDTFSVATGTAAVNDITNGDFLVSPSGFMLTYPDDSNMRAFNALGHVCTYAGIFHRITNTP